MRLYSGTTAGLIEDTTKNRIATKLSDAFFHEFRFQPGPSEVNSWRNSLRAVSQVFQEGDLLNHGVILEFQLPFTSRRLDCLVTGRNDWSRENADACDQKGSAWVHTSTVAYCPCAAMPTSVRAPRVQWQDDQRNGATRTGPILGRDQPQHGIG
jgi:hypothetical protein